MTAVKPGWSITLGLYPTSRGFGWTAFDGPLTLFDRGIYTVHREKNTKCLARAERLFERLKPESLILEQFNGRAPRSGRVQRFCLELITLAARKGIEVAVYTRAEIQQCFAGVGAMTRDQIAQAVARSVDALRLRLPNARKAWEGEDKRMALFNAAALVLTHFHFGANRLFNEIGSV